MASTRSYSLLNTDCDDSVTWNQQNVTFAISLAVQVAVLIFSIVCIVVVDERPEVLTTILWLETAVQLVEFTWYAVVGTLFVYGKKIIGRSCEFDLEYRFADWYLTTPTMLITLYFLLHYFNMPCMTNRMLREQDNFMLFLILIVVFDWAMLTIGLLYELNWFKWTSLRYPYLPMVLGFVFLLSAFVPHIDVLVNSRTTEGIVVLVLTILVWAAYGVVATWWLGRHNGTMQKNAAYNILDIFSKNCFGVLVSILALNFKSAHGTC